MQAKGWWAAMLPLLVALLSSLPDRARATQTDDGTAARAALASAVGRIVAARVAVAEFYVSQGRMPTSSREIGFPEPSAAEAVQVSIESAGFIRLAIAARAAPRRLQLFLIPRLASRGLVWSCVSPDLTAVAAIGPGCRFDAAFKAPPETPDSLEAKANPGLVIERIDGRAFRIDPRAYVSGRTDTIAPGQMRALSGPVRSRLLDTVLRSVNGHVERLDEVLNLAAWLRTIGPVVREDLERHLDDEPAIAAAALLALCEVDPHPTREARANECMAGRAARAKNAIDRLNDLAAQQLRNPFDHPYLALRDVVNCEGALAVVAALGASARPVVDSLGALLGDTRPHFLPGDYRDLCSQRDIAVTLLRVLLTPPRDDGHADLVDAAGLALVHITLFGFDRARGVAPAHLGDLLDEQDLRTRLLPVLTTHLARWRATCESVVPTAPARVTDLGLLGFDALVPMLDARAGEPACDPGSHASDALTALVAAYPDQAAAQYRRAAAVPTRDDFIAAALTLREGEQQPQSRRQLDEFLAQTGYTPIDVKDGRVTFPGAPALRWKPRIDWQVPLRTPAASTVDLSAAYRELAQRWTECRIPADDERAWTSVRRAKRLFVFECGSDDPALLVIGSPEGFKVMHVPDRLASVAFSPADAIVGVGDADHDGNIEVLLVVPCDGRDADCAEGRVPDTYEFFEEDGDWFTWFRDQGR